MKRKVLYHGKYLRLMHHAGWEFVERANCTGIVVILGITPENKVVLVEQFRMAVRKQVIEFPAGLVNDLELKKKESLKQAARREFLEETGYEAKHLRHIMTGAASPGLSADQLTFFRATGLIKRTAGGGDEIEKIKVHEVSLKRAVSWLRQMTRKGKVVDPKVYACLYFLEHNL